MKRYGFILIILILVFIIAVPVMAGKQNAYTEKDEYCIEVGWDTDSEAYFQTHGVECKFINVFINGTYRLTMHAEIPQEGDMCYEGPPFFVAEPCVYTIDDWVAAGSPRSYSSGQGCLANFLFLLNEGFENPWVWGTISEITFTPTGNIMSTCYGTP